MASDTEPTRVTATELEALCALPEVLPTEDPDQRWIRYEDSTPALFVTGIARRLFAGLDAISARASGSIQVTLERLDSVRISSAGDRDVDFRLHIASDGGALGSRRININGCVTVHRTVGGSMAFRRFVADYPADETGRPPAILSIFVSDATGEGGTTFDVPVEMAMGYLEGVIEQHLLSRAAFPKSERPTRFEHANQATLCWRDDPVWFIISDDGQPIVVFVDGGLIRYADQPQATRKWLAIDSRPEVDWPSGIVPAAEFDRCGTIVVIPTTVDRALV